VHFFESRTVWHHQTMLMVNCYFESEAMQYLKACSDEQVLVLQQFGVVGAKTGSLNRE
jgi:hypothetical protein